MGEVIINRKNTNNVFIFFLTGDGMLGDDGFIPVCTVF